MSHLCK
jgi:hypothetical protein